MEQEERDTENKDGLLIPDITPHEDIQAAALAMGVVEDLDPLLLEEEDAYIVREIKRMSIAITYQALLEIYQANLYDPNQEPS